MDKNKIALKILTKYFSADLFGDEYELEKWTNSGVDMVIYVNKDNIIGSFRDYVENFDVDEEIETYRQDEAYRRDFTFRRAVEDFENFEEQLRTILGELEVLENQQEEEVK